VITLPAVHPKKRKASVFGSKVQNEGMVGLQGECLMLRRQLSNILYMCFPGSYTFQFSGCWWSWI